MQVAQSHYTTFARESHPVYSHPAAIRVEDLARLRASSGPCHEGSNNWKIGTGREDSPAILTACPTPRLVVCRDGRSRFLGCHRSGCQVCRGERDRRLFRRVAIELKRPAVNVVYIMARFGQAAQGRFTALPDGVVRSAMLGALKAVRRARKGGRGRPSWPGCSLEYVRAVGVNDGVLAGVHHHHLVLKVSALPGAELPSLGDLKAELLFYYCKALAKGLPTKEVAEQTFPPTAKQGNLIYFEPCRDKIAAARYILCKQEGTFLPGFRRQGVSRRFFSQKGTETVNKSKNDVVDNRREQMFPAVRENGSPRGNESQNASAGLSEEEVAELRAVNGAGVNVPRSATFPDGILASSVDLPPANTPPPPDGYLPPVQKPDPTPADLLAQENAMLHRNDGEALVVKGRSAPDADEADRLRAAADALQNDIDRLAALYPEQEAAARQATEAFEVTRQGLGDNRTALMVVKRRLQVAERKN